MSELRERLARIFELPANGTEAPVPGAEARARITAGGVIVIEGEGGPIELSVRPAGGEAYWQGEKLAAGYQGDAPPGSAVLTALDRLLEGLRKAEWQLRPRDLKGLLGHVGRQAEALAAAPELRRSLESALGPSLAEGALAVRNRWLLGDLPDPYPLTLEASVRRAFLERPGEAAEHRREHLEGAGLSVLADTTKSGVCFLVAACSSADAEQAATAYKRLYDHPEHHFPFAGGNAEATPAAFVDYWESLGRPACCAKANVEDLVATMRDPERQRQHQAHPFYAELLPAAERSRRFDGKLNHAFRDHGRVWLVDHRPCRYDCKRAARDAGRVLSALRASNKESASMIEALLAAPILVFEGGPPLAWPGSKVDRKGRLRIAAPPVLPASDDALLRPGETRAGFEWAARLLPKLEGATTLTVGGPPLELDPLNRDVVDLDNGERVDAPGARLIPFG